MILKRGDPEKLMGILGEFFLSYSLNFGGTFSANSRAYKGKYQGAYLLFLSWGQKYNRFY